MTAICHISISNHTPTCIQYHWGEFFPRYSENRMYFQLETKWEPSRKIFLSLPVLHVTFNNYFTRGNKVGLRKIGPESAKILRNIDPNNLQGILANCYQSMEHQSKSPTENYCTVIGQQASAHLSICIIQLMQLIHMYIFIARLYSAVPSSWPTCFISDTLR